MMIFGGFLDNVYGQCIWCGVNNNKINTMSLRIHWLLEDLDKDVDWNSHIQFAHF